MNTVLCWGTQTRTGQDPCSKGLAGSMSKGKVTPEHQMSKLGCRSENGGWLGWSSLKENLSELILEGWVSGRQGGYTG